MTAMTAAIVTAVSMAVVGVVVALVLFTARVNQQRQDDDDHLPITPLGPPPWPRFESPTEERRALAIRQRGYAAVGERLTQERDLGVPPRDPQTVLWMWDCVETAMHAVLPNATEHATQLEQPEQPPKPETGDTP